MLWSISAKLTKGRRVWGLPSFLLDGDSQDEVCKEGQRLVTLITKISDPTITVEVSAQLLPSAPATLAVTEGNNTRNATVNEVINDRFKAASVEFIFNGQKVEVVLDRRTNEIIVHEENL